MTPAALAALSGPPPASVVPATVAGCGYGADQYAGSGCSPPTANMAMKYSPSSTYSTPSPPGVQVHHQRHQLAEHQRPGPSATMHHFSSYGPNVYNGNACAMPSRPPTYEETVNGQHQSVPLPPQVHLHWYPTSVIASHDSAADGLQWLDVLIVTDGDEECREEARLVLPIWSRTEIESEARRILRIRFFFSINFIILILFFLLLSKFPVLTVRVMTLVVFLNMYVILGNYFYFVIIIISYNFFLHYNYTLYIYIIIYYRICLYTPLTWKSL